MDSTSLTPDQLERLRLSVTRMRNYLGRLRGRMGKLAFPDADPLMTAARRAADAIEELHGVILDLQQRANLPRHAGGQRPVEVRRDPRARRT